jgi:hypothetical protein
MLLKNVLIMVLLLQSVYFAESTAAELKPARTRQISYSPAKQACTECRESKVRCFPGVPWCLRCTERGLECIYKPTAAALSNRRKAIHPKKMLGISNTSCTWHMESGDGSELWHELGADCTQSSMPIEEETAKEEQVSGSPPSLVTIDTKQEPDVYLSDYDTADSFVGNYNGQEPYVYSHDYDGVDDFVGNYMEYETTTLVTNYNCAFSQLTCSCCSDQDTQAQQYLERVVDGWIVSSTVAAYNDAPYVQPYGNPPQLRN